MIIIFINIIITSTIYLNFLERQKGFERVKIALRAKESIISEKLDQFGIRPNNINIIIIIYKSEDILEIYGTKKMGAIYQKLISYDICSRSGQLGPKRQSGDNQVPEGFYHINRFNPLSKFYLSIGLNYPNSSDKLKSKQQT